MFLCPIFLSRQFYHYYVGHLTYTFWTWDGQVLEFHSKGVPHSDDLKPHLCGKYSGLLRTLRNICELII